MSSREASIAANEPPFRRALDTFLAALRERENLFHAITRALACGTGWRWVLVTRFKPGDAGTIEILGCWCNGAFVEPSDYALRQTPCERVAEAGGFCYFDHASARFPEDAFLEQRGITEYAGQVYRDPDTQQQLGHLVAMNDRPTASEQELRQLFDLLSLMMGLELRHRNPGERRDEADRAARTDPLTGLGNRRAFHAALARHALERPLGLQLALLELERRATASDIDGSGAQDAVIRRFAAALARAAGPHDDVFRLGGDRFAWLGIGAEVRLRTSIEQALRETRAALAAEHPATAHLDGDTLRLQLAMAEARRHGWAFGSVMADAEQRLLAAGNDGVEGRARAALLC